MVNFVHGRITGLTRFKRSIDKLKVCLKYARSMPEITVMLEKTKPSNIRVTHELEGFKKTQKEGKEVN